jgi:protein-S-isoprenylcysteine O-methyltransferase Ste14
LTIASVYADDQFSEMSGVSTVHADQCRGGWTGMDWSCIAACLSWVRLQGCGRRQRSRVPKQARKVRRSFVGHFDGTVRSARHPMYSGVLIMDIGVPLALDSWLGSLVLLVTIPVLIWRILDEEKLLANELCGYRDYANRVRYRLVPFVW